MESTNYLTSENKSFNSSNEFFKLKYLVKRKNEENETN